MRKFLKKIKERPLNFETWRLVKIQRLIENKPPSNPKYFVDLLHTDSQEYSRMEKGYNSDVIFRGLNFHVQSEDWGVENPYLVSRVYQNGAVIKSIKTSYSEVLGPGLINRYRIDSQAIRLALREQHQKILDLLLSGQLF